MLLYIVEANKGCKKKSLNILSLEADLLKAQSNTLQNTPMQYTAIFHGCKNDNFQFNFFDFFHIFAQNIYCGYALEPPHRGGSNEYPRSMFQSKNKKIMYTPVNPNFAI